MRAPERLIRCIDLLLDAGGTTEYNAAPILAVPRGRLEHLTALLDADLSLVDWRFPELDFGATGGRMLTLRSDSSARGRRAWKPRCLEITARSWRCRECASGDS